MTKVSRRTFVLGSLGAVVAPPAPAYPFTLGVASGEPAHDSVVLWTRLAPVPLAEDGQGGMSRADVAVDWQVSATDSFAKPLAYGTVTARHADAHSVHVVAGGLAPDADYFYRFRTQGHISPVGRTRTTPAVNATGRDLTMLFASCANFEHGFFTAYRRMAEENPGLILHLGDYIYEGAPSPERPRQHLGPEVLTLADYRRRYGQYKVDPDLQAAHAVAPWLVVPDDHDVENDYAGTHRLDNIPPLTQAQWTARHTAAYRAYYEHLPLRPSAAPFGTSMRVYRRIRWGRLATFHMLDTRQFRDPQACGGAFTNCPDADRPGRTITGQAQEKWLLDGLAKHEATWDVLGQQVFFAQHLDARGAGTMDYWDGYRASRARLQQGWTDRKVRNPVVLTGDIHQAWANELKANYKDPSSRTVGTELVCTSITSRGDGTPTTAVPLAATNPHLKFYSDRRGYVRTTIARDRLRADFRALDTVTRRDAPARTVKSFVILDGKPGLRTP
ncbi:alkaline phosphatase D family protein [Paractinoplanes lichenicola]|uniref:Alkaline phosphatase D family protein n=1 Tax=Paractinoplanes lichenicola TaxID=2802976 RepID=A0ABS1VWN2_9ACTN|nr:alkaline phosphatase D family protein [Actinoplanes lichenicola]MBL7258838.1 alkaline phosphatase D family protein [Actinoplanes lichenicola]